MNTSPPRSANAELLIDLYNRTSKHGQYQQIAKPLHTFLPSENLRIRSRYEEERLAFILNNTAWRSASIADIGGNTGFFSLELIAHGAANVAYFEGNFHHARFVQQALSLLGWEDRISIRNEYFDFNPNPPLSRFDICLVLNVLHHIGDDFGQGGEYVTSARTAILEALAKLARHTKTLVLQIGFNWMGNIKLPLFANGTKNELISFISEGTKNSWKIKAIGIAERASGGIAYRNLTKENIKREDSLGEFLNRPIFVMESCVP